MIASFLETYEQYNEAIYQPTKNASLEITKGLDFKKSVKLK